MTLTQALEAGRKKRKSFHPNSNFQEQLRIYERTILSQEDTAKVLTAKDVDVRHAQYVTG